MIKKILVVTTRPLEVNTSSSIRKISTIKVLISEGAEITVLTTSIPTETKNYNNKVELDIKKTIRVNAGTIYRLGVQSSKDNSLSNYIKKKLRKIYYRFRIYDPLKSSIYNLKYCKDELENYYDIILSISDPKTSHLLAIELINLKMVKYDKYIQIWGDPMYLDITNKSLVPKYFIMKEEKKLLSYADKIYYVSPLTLIEEQQLFPEFAKAMDVLIPPCVNKVIYKDVLKVKKLGYFGDYNSNVRNILPLYNAIKNSNYELIICGNSDIELKSTSNIKIKGRIPFDKIRELEEEVDMLVHLSNSSGTQIPGKIYQYICTNKPILFILDGQIERIKKFFEPLNRFVFTINTEDEIIKNLNLFNENVIRPDNKPINKYDARYYREKIIEL
jgi:hypothetical protein